MNVNEFHDEFWYNFWLNFRLNFDVKFKRFFSDPHSHSNFLGFVHSPKPFMKQASLMEQSATILPNWRILENEDPTKNIGNSLRIHTNAWEENSLNIQIKEAVNLFWSGLLWSPRGGGRRRRPRSENKSRNLVLTPSRSDLVVER